MNQQQPPAKSEQELQTLAALYVAGALTDEETKAIETDLNNEHLMTGHRLAQEIRKFEDVARVLCDRLDDVMPLPATRREMLKRIRDDLQSENTDRKTPVWHAWNTDVNSEPDLFTLRASDGNWDETGVDGIQVRRLFIDPANNRMTAMFRMEPGSCYVPHRHDGAEECYVLSGDLHVGEELVLTAGDYQRADAGSLHGEQWTEGGCVLLISSSLHDEQFYTDSEH